MSISFVQMVVEIGILSREAILKHIQVIETQNITDVSKYFLLHKVLSIEEVDFVNECLSLQLKHQRLGHFFVQQKIGEGGMGVIYKAYDLRSRRVVALKIIKNTSNSSLRFQREMQLLAQIHHPNIVTFYGVHQINNILLYSMEYIKGKTLSQSKELSIYKISKIMSQVSSAIHFIHRLGIIHRDIKPSNIMITEDFIPKIMDFGLAKEESALSGLTQSGVFIGTIHYASPEQIRGEKLDSSSDIYSLGATLHKLLTHKNLFDAKSVHGIARKIIEDQPLNPRKIKKNLPLPLAMICLKALQKEKEKRYQSAAAMSDDLQRFLKKRLVKAGENYFSYVLSHQIKKMAKIFVIPLIILMIIIISILFFYQWQDYLLYKQSQEKYSLYQNIIAEVTTIEEIMDANFLEQIEISAPLAQKLDHAISICLKARSVLQEIRFSSVTKINIEKELYGVEKQIGLLALMSNRFVLSKVSFYRCRNLGYGNEIIGYLELLQEKQQKVADYPFQRLQEILNKVQEGISQEEFNDYTTEIARICDRRIQEKLVDLLQSENINIKKFAIDVIGKTENPNISVAGKDYCEWLLYLLKNEKNEQVLIRIIWALGRLKDLRAWGLIKDKKQKREFHSFEHSISLPFSWLANQIPIDVSKWKKPEDLLSYINLYYYRKQYEKVIELCEQYLKLDIRDNDKLETQEITGLCYVYLHQDKKAIKYLEQLILLYSKIIDETIDNNEKYDLKMGLSRAHQNVAAVSINLYQSTSDPMYLEKAIVGFNGYIEMEPMWSGPNRGLAQVYVLQEKYQEALEQCELAIEKSRNFVSDLYLSYQMKSYVHSYFKQYEKALEAINKAITIEPTVFELYFFRAQIYQKMDRLMDAYTDCSHALQLNPQNLEAKSFLTKLKSDIENKKENK